MLRILSRREVLGSVVSSFVLVRTLSAADGISVGMIPDAGATRVAIDQKAPLRDYLAKAIGQAVKLVIPTNYNATVEALGNGSLDFAYLGALTYLKAHERYGVIPLVQRSIDKQFHSIFVTQSSSAIKTLADTKCKSFAFGDINSTSGHLIPYRELKKAGVDADRDLKFRYTGSHSATLKAVETGASDAGALDETVFKSMIADGSANGSKVRIFHTSEPFVDYVWVANKSVSPATRDKFANAFLKLKPGQNDEILEILRGKEFVRVSDSEYEFVRSVASELKML
jgi:phosphonate transport system substrate-binding protein